MATLDASEERTLVAAVQAGDRAALERLLREHQPRIHTVCRRLTGNDADALDATQEALIAIVRTLPRFDGRSRLSTWIYRIATNACLDELRRRRRRPLLGADVDDREGRSNEPVDDRRPSIDDEVSERMRVDQALAELAPDFRAAVVLRDLCQLDYGEIAEVLEIPPGTVRSRIARGRRHLADLLGNQDLPPDRLNAAP